MRTFTKFKIGDKINNWTIISELIYITYPYMKQKAHECRCSCGTVRIKTISALKSGKAKSCGCLRDQVITPARNSTHGGSKTRLYQIWKAMRRRCQLPTDSIFYRYGGRGIIVCKEWRADFSVFRDWALNNGYNDNLTIDRIDGQGNYCPENCRWATYQEQANNLITNHILNAFKEQKTIAEWSRDPRCAVSLRGLRSRIARGWNHEDAISRPKFSRIQNYKITSS